MKRSRRLGAEIQSPAANSGGTPATHAAATGHGGWFATPSRIAIPAAHVAAANSAQRNVSNAITRALAWAAGSPASRSAQKSTVSPPIVEATVKAPNDSPTTRTTSEAGSRG